MDNLQMDEKLARLRRCRREMDTLKKEAELTAALPELVRKVAVIQTVSDELWEQAKLFTVT